MSEEVIILKFKELFSRYGISDIVRTDNGPQFQFKFKKFSESYNFVHETSSPYFPQSNGQIEATVKIAKNLIKKNVDIFEALLAYRTTPLSNGFTPGELLMGRKLKSKLPLMEEHLKPLTPNVTVVSKKMLS